jgi:hypothetical protein
MHEQLLHRILRDASKALDAMKAKRTAARQTALDAARAQHNLNRMLGVPELPNETPVSVGFVFTSDEIEIESRRHSGLLEAKIQKIPPKPRHRSRHIKATASIRIIRVHAWPVPLPNSMRKIT